MKVQHTSFPPPATFSIAFSAAHASSLALGLAVAGIAAVASQANAASSTWNVDSLGNFSAPGNWSNGVPGATSGTTSADIATFQRSTISAARTVTLDTAYNIGGITINNNGSTDAAVFTIGNNSSNNFTMSAGAVIQNIGNQTGRNAITSPLTLAGNLTVSNNNANSSGSLQFGVSGTPRSMTTAASLGNVSVTFNGSNTSTDNVSFLTYNQGTGTTLQIVKDGSGYWQLNNIGASTMTGGILIKNGTLVLGSSVAASVGTIAVGDSTSSGTLTMGLGSGVTVANAITIAASPASNVVFSRTGGSGAATFSGAITLGRDLTLIQGTANTQALNLDASSSVGGTGNLIVATAVNSTGAVNLQGSVNMTGKLINQSSAGTSAVTASGALGISVTEVVQNSATSKMVLSGTNTNFAGAVTVTAGTLQLGNVSALNANNQVTVATGAIFDINANDVMIGGLGTGTGTVTNTGAAKTLTLSGGTNKSFGGVITASTPANMALTVALTGGATQTLTGTNTYSGATQVNSGKLVVGVAGAGSITSNVTVASGATVGGSGTITGNVTLSGESALNAKNGGKLAAGNSPGVLTATGTTTFNTGSIFSWELDTDTSNPGRGTEYDGVNTAALAGSDAVFHIVLSDTEGFGDNFWATTHHWSDIFKNATGTTNLTNWSSIFTSFAYTDGTNNLTPVGGSFAWTGANGNTLTWSAVPEPTSALSSLLITAGLLRRRRK